MPKMPWFILVGIFVYILKHNTSDSILTRGVSIVNKMAAEFIEKSEQEFKESDPREREHFINSSLSLLQQIIGDAKKLT